MNLHPLPGDGRFYCGPAAIASFTGLHPKEQIRAAINELRGRKPTQGVIGMKLDEVASVMQGFGFSTYSFTFANRPMLKDFLTHYPDCDWIVNVTGHFVAYSAGMVQDNQSGAIYPLAKFSGLRKRVKHALRIIKKG